MQRRHPIQFGLTEPTSLRAGRTSAESLREELRALTTRALRQYEPRGRPLKGGLSARQATLITPGQYTDRTS